MGVHNPRGGCRNERFLDVGWMHRVIADQASCTDSHKCNQIFHSRCQMHDDGEQEVQKKESINHII